MSWSILKLLREKPEELKEHVKKRFMDPSIVDEAYKTDLEWRRTLTYIQELRHKHNVVSREIPKLKGVDKEKKIKEAKQLLKELEEVEKKLKELEEKRQKLLFSLPNIVHETVPVGPDDTYNVPIRFWGKPRVWKGFIDQFKEQTEKYGFKVEYEVIDWKPVGHADMLEKVLRLGDTFKAGQVAGSRFYYLFNDIVFLDMALLAYAIDYLTSKGYTLVLPPYMLRHKVMMGVIDMDTFKDAIYKIEGEDLYLIATAEHPLAALHAWEDIPEEELPLKYVGISPCFRKEAGAGNRDLKGIFRVHQFHKVEQFVYAKPEDSWDIMEELISNAEHLFRGLGIPYRIVNIASGDLGAPAAKKYDLEAWMPAQGRYREMVSCSNVTDWQAFRLRIRLIRRKGMVKEYLHTLNSTAIASTRTITAILENFQEPDGTVIVPKVLRKYLEVFKSAPIDAIHPVKKEKN
ncbi:seryl-tRNA synthetase [Staphylothermus marinus F1]|uniref:Serine--tRNA ligase n=1 Tax=Staphylothermus marinus (strain ATCC 43588 / DSM 3639 / JCM 9404 / F1) TaxID=399550 RepID=SYS_STAMF|nr:serine--tRNA ligase [Staphylothermus marinus]A3DP85.1 RecName: Full=Serine--tRNA ligase; AltName: Full=Seryl-tRNA synthetase; Short=SerRS; AltName: Full=Seryl-tRNA(Ser/Sec) synthetase [Staphylothermus marinus F1]ABN70445.1 seryl-tRNA synthetase [Staphylothermus marinus F1]